MCICLCVFDRIGCESERNGERVTDADRKANNIKIPTELMLISIFCIDDTSTHIYNQKKKGKKILNITSSNIHVWNWFMPEWF